MFPSNVQDEEEKGLITLEEGWRDIEEKAIRVLQNYLEKGDEGKTKLFSNLDFANIYTVCYNMCTQRTPFNWSEELYLRHGQTFADYLSECVVPSLRDKPDTTLLTELVRRWENHVIMNKWMKKFFMYLDRYYVKYHTLPGLEEAGLSAFRKLVFEAVKRPVCNALLQLVENEREGIAFVDRDLMKSCICLYEAMGMGGLDVYVQDLENPLLAASREFYRKKAAEWLQTDSTSAYLVKVEKSLEEERVRVFHYLNPETEHRLLRVIDEEALEKTEAELLAKEGSGCRALLANDRTEDLARMFRLLSRLPDGLAPMADLFRLHVASLGNEKIEQRVARIEGGVGAPIDNDDDGAGVKEKIDKAEKGGDKDKESNEDPVFVRDLLALHDKYLAMVADQFSGNALFQRALKDAFSETVNRSVGKHTNAELLSSFCDRVLKTGGEKVSETEAEELLEKVVQLFSYLTDKDLFSELYRHQLAKRLLNQRSASDEMERLMIGKLKIRCGAQFTTKMEGMLNDLAIGVDHRADFDKYVKESGLSAGAMGKMEFTVQVLTTGHWPTYKNLEVTLPAPMSHAVQVFREFYEDKNGSSRRLAYTYSLGTATVKAVFGKRTYDLQLATIQVPALMLFNETPGPLSFETIQQMLNLPEDVLKRVLHSLACGKYKVLKKEGKDGNNIKNTDVFAFNEGFTCPLRKVRIPMASLDESHNPKKVEEDRSIVIEAAIVRIMKARKTLSHQQLVGEVLTQLAFFKPSPRVIKGRIEALIGREFLERDTENSNTYKYVA